MKYPRQFERLIIELERLPGVGMKMAYRIAYKIFLDRSSKHTLIEAVRGVDELKLCKVCNCISEEEICEICANENRDSSKIMVVEDYTDLVNIENSASFDGYYYIIGGLISPVNNIMPENLKLAGLSKRVIELSQKTDSLEVIFALNPILEGESTIIYIKKELEEIPNIQFSQIALGVPRGADIEYIDPDTLKYAIGSRNNI